MKARLLTLPDRDLSDVPRALRVLADQIEAGEFDDAHNVAWVCDCGDGRIEMGMMGRAAHPGAEAHLLFGIAMSKLQSVG